MDENGLPAVERLGNRPVREPEWKRVLSNFQMSLLGRERTALSRLCEPTFGQKAKDREEINTEILTDGHSSAMLIQVRFSVVI